MNAWKIALVCTLAMLAPILMVCMAGGAVAGGATGHRITHSAAGTIEGVATGAVIGHKLSK